ncbi:hypothetical protein [Nocardioides sp. 616]|uniref:SWIM zinc finger family protein n=1 Tax=Nocardioides sp. 616 TaxID=2268090 RepID=UPI000CE530E1|nr:hypothetical protein [Nocardioides sp. 616]
MNVSYPQLEPRRGSSGSTWWGKAWTRSLEEAAYGEEELKQGRRLARNGAVGAITVSSGGYLAAVQDRGDAWTVTGTVEPLDETSRHLFAEVVAGSSGRVASLLRGDLPLPLVEDCEEVGVELVPYAGELGWTCTCAHWVDPCPHGVAVAVQVGWLLQADALVLLHLRGLAREELLAAVHALATSGPDVQADVETDMQTDVETDVETGVDAALRAGALLDQWEHPPSA